MQETCRDGLTELIPDNCRSCRRAIVAAAGIAFKAVEAGACFEVAANRYNQIIDHDCNGPEPPTCSTTGCKHKNGDSYLSDAANNLTF